MDERCVRYRKILENMSDGMVELDDRGRFLFLSPQVEALIGFSSRELMGTSGFDLIHPDDLERAAEGLAEILEKGRIKSLEYRMRKKDGKYIHFNTSARLVREEDGTTSIIAVIRDVSHLRKVEADLRESEEFYRKLVDTSPDAITITDMTGRIIQSNRKAVEMFGYDTFESLIDRRPNVLDHMDMSDRMTGESILSRLLAGEAITSEEVRAIRRDDSPFPVELSASLVRGRDGEPKAIMGIMRDLTPWKKNQEDLRTSEERYRTLFDLSPEGITMVDLGGKIIDINEAQLRMLPFSKEQLIGMNFLDLDYLPEARMGEFLEIFSRLVRGESVEPIEISFESGGDVRYLEVYPGLVRQGSEVTAIQVISVDITRKKIAEQGLMERSATMQSIFRAAPIGIGMVVDRVVTAANDRLLEMIGYSLEEVLGKSARMLYPTQEDYDFVGREKYDQISKHGTGTVETRWQKKDGGIIDVLLSSTPIDNSDLSRGVTFTALDVTDRKAAFRAISESENKFRSIVSTSPMGMHLYELQEGGGLVLTGANDSADRILGIDHGQLIGRTIEEAFPGLAGTEVPERYRQAARDGVEWRTERIEYDDGGIKGAFEVVAFQVEPMSMAVMFNDITERKASAERMRLLSEFLDAAPAAITVYDLGGRMLFTNKKNLDLHGYTEDEFGTLRLSDILTAEHAAQVEDRVRSISAGLDVSFEVDHLRKDGSVLPMQVTARSVEWYGTRAILSIGTDISERKRSESTFRQWTDIVGSMIAQPFIGMLILDEGGRILEWNQALEKLFGLRAEDVKGRFGWDVQLMLLPPEKRTEEMLSHLRSSSLRLLEDPDLRINNPSVYTVPRGDDGDIVLQQWTFRIKSVRGYRLGMFTFDITDLKRYEQELSRSEMRYRNLIDNANETILVAQDGVTKFINPMGTRLVGFRRDEMVLRPFTSFIHPEDVEMVSNNCSRRIKGDERVGRYPFRVVYKDRRIRWVEIDAVLIEWEGRPATLNFLTDITDRKLAEEALCESEDKYRTLLSNLANVVIEVTPYGDVTYVSPRIHDILGYEPGEVIGRNGFDFVDPETVHIDFDSLAQDIREGNQSFNMDFKVRHKDGTYRDINVSTRRVDAIGGSPKIVGILTDVTDQRRLEAERDRFFNNTLDMLCIADFDAYFRQLNPAFERTLGWSVEEMKARKFLDLVHPDDVATTIDAMKGLSEGERITGFENRYLCKDGTYRWLSWNAYPLIEEELIFAVARDVTEKKNYEARLNEERSRAEFYLDLLSHDIGNLHQGISSWTQLALDAREDRRRLDLSLRRIDDLQKRALRLVKNVLLLSRLKILKVELENIELNRAVLKAFKEASGMFPDKDIKLVLSSPGGKHHVMAENLLEEVFFNLFQNSFKFQDADSGPIEVELSADPEAKKVRIRVSDRGPGIPDELKDRIFHRSSRSGEFKNTGIGLSLVRELVERYGGSIAIEDRVKGSPGEGVSFVIDLRSA